MRTRAHGYAVHAEKTPLAPFTFERRDLRPNDVGIEILYCGVCHSDLHTARGDWDGLIYPNGTVYPCVPGHEIVGRVTAVGSAVGKFKQGQCLAMDMWFIEREKNLFAGHLRRDFLSSRA